MKRPGWAYYATYKLLFNVLAVYDSASWFKQSIVIRGPGLEVFQREACLQQRQPIVFLFVFFWIFNYILFLCFLGPWLLLNRLACNSAGSRKLQDVVQYSSHTWELFCGQAGWNAARSTSHATVSNTARFLRVACMYVLHLMSCQEQFSIDKFKFFQLESILNKSSKHDT